MDVYSFLDTVMLVNGNEITGWAEGDDAINIARREDSASDMVGADGEMAVALSANRSGELTIRLKQTAASNAYLSSLVAAMENGAFVPVFVQFKDTRGNDLGSGTQGYIRRPADMQRGTGINTQEWVIVVERLDMLHLGLAA